MTARLLAVALVVGPGIASAKGGHGGHIHSGGFGGRGFGNGMDSSSFSRTEAVREWSTPVDQEPDWEQREAAPTQGVPTRPSHGATPLRRGR